MTTVDLGPSILAIIRRAGLRQLCWWRAVALTLAAAAASGLGSGVHGQSQTYDMRQFWPFPDVTLEYSHYDAAGQPLSGATEKIHHERWPDGDHFTIHHWWDSWCPRIDDVMVWSEDVLLHTETYHFPEGHLTQFQPGHLWVDRYMTLDAEARQADTDHVVFGIRHADCTVTDRERRWQTRDRVWRRLLGGNQSWSPFTGGPSRPVAVIRLDETTYINNDLNDWFREEWHFYQHETLGWIPIHSNGYRKSPTDLDPRFQWSARLIRAGDAAPEPTATVPPPTAPPPEPTSTPEAPGCDPSAGAPDPLLSEQWGLAKIAAPSSWAYSQGDCGVMIAVVDTGVDYGHVELGGTKTSTAIDFDFANGDDDARDDNGHGTHVAGIAAAASFNGHGIAGVCPLCAVLAVKAMDSTGVGSDHAIAQGVRYAVDAGARVINLSLGADVCPPELASAVNYAYDRGATIIAAAGNQGSGECPLSFALDGQRPVVYPAKFERVISVSATDRADAPAAFSAYGPEVDLAAPGVDILSTYVGGSFERLSGTSMAAPHVAGVAGQMMSVWPGASPASVRDILIRTADDVGAPGRDDYTGWGRINAMRALSSGPPEATNPAPPASCAGASPVQQGDLLDLYRALRDEVLRHSSAGRRFAAQYYLYGPEVTTMLANDANLRARAAQLVRSAEMPVRSLVEGDGGALLNSSLHQDAERLVQDIAALASPGLRARLTESWAELDLAGHVGKPVRTILEDLSEPHIYLPAALSASGPTGEALAGEAHSDG